MEKIEDVLRLFEEFKLETSFKKFVELCKTPELLFEPVPDEIAEFLPRRDTAFDKCRQAVMLSDKGFEFAAFMEMMARQYREISAIKRHLMTDANSVS